MNAAGSRCSSHAHGSERLTQDAGIASFRLDSIYTRDLAIIDMGVVRT